MILKVAGESIDFCHGIDLLKLQQKAFSAFTFKKMSFAPLIASVSEPSIVPKSWADLARPEDDETVDFSEFQDAFASLICEAEKATEKTEKRKQAEIILPKKVEKEDCQKVLVSAKEILAKFQGIKPSIIRWEIVSGSLSKNIDAKLFSVKCTGCRHETCTHVHTSLLSEKAVIEAINSVKSKVVEFQGKPTVQNLMAALSLISDLEKNIAGLKKDLATAENQLIPCRHWLTGNCAHQTCEFGHPEKLKGTVKKEVPVCKHWETHAICTYEGCKFAHPEDKMGCKAPKKTGKTDKTDKAKTKTCKHWAKGFCKNSDEACGFAHWTIK